MNRSSKARVTGVRKSNNPRLGKGCKKPLSNTVKTKAAPPTLKDISAAMIQRAWVSHLDTIIFRLLKQTICAAEHCVTHEILKKVCPLEADLVKDPSMRCKVRFRFSGETFPPFIVFKIFHHTKGYGCKYITGKNMLKPSSKAAVDAYKIMGQKKFYEQIMEDERFSQKFKITDVIDIVTWKDYRQYSSLLDETPASFGGRNNYWRRLDLRNIPRTMIMYDIVNYAESGVITNRLQKEMKYLSQRPKTEEMRREQLRVVSEIRYSSSLSRSQPLYQPYQQQSQMKHLVHRSKQAQMKVEKMKKADEMAKKVNASVGTKLQKDTPSRKQQQMTVFSTPSFDIVKIKDLKSDEKLEKKEKVFIWCQKLYTHHFPSI